MAKLNSSYKFAEKKSNTVPVVAVPKKVKDALCVDKAYANGVFKIEPMDGVCVYDQCYVFEDINYINLDKDKKVTTLEELVKIFKALSFQAKFTVANDTQDVKTFVKDIFKPIHGEEYPVIETGIGQWINQKIDEGTRDIKRVMYLTVTCRAQSEEEAVAYFATLDTSLQGIFTALRSKLYRLSAEERFAVLQKILRVGEVGIIPTKISPNHDGWKNQIMPASIISGEDCLQINNRYVSVLFAQDFDSSLDDEKIIHSLTDKLFPIYITLDIEPIDRNVLRDKLVASHTNNETAISNENDQNVRFNQFGKGPSYSLGKKKKELEFLMHQVDDADEEAMFLSLLVVVHAETMEELIYRVETLQQVADSNGYRLVPYYHRQLKALMTALPIGGRQVNCMRSFLTRPAAAFNPFYAKDLQDPNGFILGLNKTTKRLLRGDKKALMSPHSIICGHTGSGKSMYLKLTDISQTLLFTDDDIICIDPENELKEYCEQIRGQFIDLTPQCEIYRNSLEVPLFIWESDEIVRNRFVAKKCDFGGRFVAACMKNIVVTQLHLNFVAKAIREVYAEYFAQGKYKKQPTWVKVRDKLIEYQNSVTLDEERKILLDIISSTEEYIQGVYDMFAHPSNIDTNNRLTVYGLKNIPDNAKKPIMLTLMHCIQEQVEYNKEQLRASRLIVDESQVLCEDEFTSTELLYAIETYRKSGGIITLLFQNMKHAIENPNLRDMLSNCPCKVFFDQGGVDAQELAKIQEFSEVEYKALTEKTPGHGVLIWNNQVYLFDAEIDREENELYSIINTNFHEKATIQKEIERIESGEVIKERILNFLEISAMDEDTLINMCLSHGNYSQIKRKLDELEADGTILRKGEHIYLRDNHE